MAQARTLVGLDVHATKIVAAILDVQTGELQSFRLRGCPIEAAELCAKLPAPVRATYEAGPTGYGLARELAKRRRGPPATAPGSRGSSSVRRPPRRPSASTSTLAMKVSGGFLNRPDLRQEVLYSARRAVELASALGSPCINTLVGNSTGVPRDDQFHAVVRVLRDIASLAEATEVTVLVEALNSDENPTYLFRDMDEASQVVERVAHPQVKPLFDAYHAARAGRDIETDFLRHRERIAPIQIADSPGRHEPGTGEVDFGASSRRRPAPAMREP